MKADFHMHTSFSSDCETPVEEMIKGAIEKGLEVICFTDHKDTDYPQEGSFDFDVKEYFTTLEKLKDKYREKIDIRIGVELGLQAHLGNYYNQYINQNPFDFVIGSLHVIEGMDPYYPGYFGTRTDAEGYAQAFREMRTCIEAIDDFDVLGHIDYVVRYGKEQAKHYSYELFRHELDLILKEIIEKGKGIELNTAGFKYGLGFAHPHPDILKRYRELGGEIITVGADGHRPEHIAYDFGKVSELLKSCGFEYYTEFSNRKPIFKQLP